MALAEDLLLVGVVLRFPPGTDDDDEGVRFDFDLSPPPPPLLVFLFFLIIFLNRTWESNSRRCRIGGGEVDLI